MKRKFKVTIAYDGADFFGYQVQGELRTIQGEIEKVLKNMHGYWVKTVASGRTDRGVHANGQVFHFESRLEYPIENFKILFRGELPSDIVVREFIEVDRVFHARFGVREKEYRYFINTGLKDPTLRNNRWFVNDINIKKILEAKEVFEGTHDFRSFGGGKEHTNCVRTISEIKLVWIDEETFYLSFIGNGFLRYMVRVLVKCLIEVGLSNLTKGDLQKLMEKKDRAIAPSPAPPMGLFLWEVKY